MCPYFKSLKSEFTKLKAENEMSLLKYEWMWIEYEMYSGAEFLYFKILPLRFTHINECSLNFTGKKGQLSSDIWSPVPTEVTNKPKSDMNQFDQLELAICVGKSFTLNRNSWSCGSDWVDWILHTGSAVTPGMMNDPYSVFWIPLPSIEFWTAPQQQLWIKTNIINCWVSSHRDRLDKPLSKL